MSEVVNKTLRELAQIATAINADIGGRHSLSTADRASCYSTSASYVLALNDINTQPVIRQKTDGQFVDDRIRAVLSSADPGISCANYLETDPRPSTVMRKIANGPTPFNLIALHGIHVNGNGSVAESGHVLVGLNTAEGPLIVDVYNGPEFGTRDLLALHAIGVKKLAAAKGLGIDLPDDGIEVAKSEVDSVLQEDMLPPEVFVSVIPVTARSLIEGMNRTAQVNTRRAQFRSAILQNGKFVSTFNMGSWDYRQAKEALGPNQILVGTIDERTSMIFPAADELWLIQGLARAVDMYGEDDGTLVGGMASFSRDELDIRRISTPEAGPSL